MADDRTTSNDKQESVLGSLPSTRPERLGRARREIAVPTAQPRGPRPAKATPPRAKAAAPKTAKKAVAADQKPIAVPAGCPPLERPKMATPPPPRPIGAPSGTEL